MDDLTEFADKIIEPTLSVGGCLARPIAEKDTEKKDSGHSYTQYSVSDNKFFPCGDSVKVLPEGVYTTCSTPDGQFYFRKENLVVDNLIYFEDGAPKEILDEIQLFWDKYDTFKTYGFLHKRGVLLYGRPGGGKSCLVQQIMYGIQKLGGIVLLCVSPNYAKHGLQIIRNLEPKRPIVVVYEDIDSIIKEYGESELLSLLDGEAQVDRVLNLATTNYPERLEKRIVNRSRRFDRVIRIGMPDERMRRAYFTQKLNLHRKEVEKYVKASENFTFAAMAELVIATKCLDKNFDDVVKHLKNLNEMCPSSTEDEDRKKLGF